MLIYFAGKEFWGVFIESAAGKDTFMSVTANVHGRTTALSA